jgi:hypothetical protein
MSWRPVPGSDCWWPVTVRPLGGWSWETYELSSGPCRGSDVGHPAGGWKKAALITSFFHTRVTASGLPARTRSAAARP